MKAVMYHYVRPKDLNFPGLYRLDYNDFKNQLDYFQKNYGFIDRNKFIDVLKNKDEIPKGVVLTFDDALSCHYNYVFKELKKRNLWGIFYVPTLPFSNNKILDVHRIHILISRISSKLIYENLMEKEIHKLFDESKLEEFNQLTYWNQTNDQYTLLVKRILNYFIKYEYREKEIDNLFKLFIPNKISVDEFYLSIDNLKEMKSDGMIIGSHTVSHKVMSKLPVKIQKQEIFDSFNYIEQRLGYSDLKTFCYPYGGFHSFNDNTEQMLNKMNVDFSFNVEERDVSKFDLLNRKQALPRYDCNHFKYGKTKNA